MLKLITPAAATTAVSLADLKAHLAIDGTDHDTRLTALLEAALAYCQGATGRPIVAQTWELHLCSFPCNKILLPRPPLASVTHLKYYDVDNVLTTIDSADYRVLLPSIEQGWIELVDPNEYWPEVYERSDAVQIRFVTSSTVPEQAKHAIKLLCGAWNEGREGEVIGTITKTLELGVAALLGQITWYTYV